MRVYWKDSAIDDVDEIYEKLKFRRTKSSADREIDKIFDKADLLESFPEMGSVQENHNAEGLKVRYLVEGKHKILYQINSSQGLVEILAVFDTRQDPSRMLSKEE
jgi:plasmid stabilization system protein ParE